MIWNVIEPFAGSFYLTLLVETFFCWQLVYMSRYLHNIVAYVESNRHLEEHALFSELFWESLCYRLLSTVQTIMFDWISSSENSIQQSIEEQEEEFNNVVWCIWLVSFFAFCCYPSFVSMTFLEQIRRTAYQSIDM